MKLSRIKCIPNFTLDSDRAGRFTRSVNISFILAIAHYTAAKTLNMVPVEGTAISIVPAAHNALNNSSIWFDYVPLGALKELFNSSFFYCLTLLFSKKSCVIKD